MEINSYYKRHTGPRFDSAGLRVQFDERRGEPGIHYGTDVSREYQSAIVKGLEDGLAIRFPDYCDTASIRIEGADEDPVSSSQMAFYLVARCIIEQAYILNRAKPRDLKA